MKDIVEGKETVWLSPHRLPVNEANGLSPFSPRDLDEAENRLHRFAPYIAKIFPETAEQNGIIESPLIKIPEMQERLEKDFGVPIPGTLMLKRDDSLPISGSIKARGGIYEVLFTAERIAMEEGLIEDGTDYSVFASDKARKIFSKYSLAVGSTGNLGLSIGIAGSALGFSTTVHMSSDASPWKKALLRQKGVTVVEYEHDYSEAVKAGREAAEKDPKCHFIDDENSITLFLGYSVAARRLAQQLKELGIIVDIAHPLIVSIPCGVGGAPGGVAWGLAQEFGDAVYTFFVEPTESCCMTLGMATGLHSEISVQDFGLGNNTIADGLAVGRASGFVGRIIARYISGCATMTDGHMLQMLSRLNESENIFMEPSAQAGFYLPVLWNTDPVLKDFADRTLLAPLMKNATHIVWGTGGSMVPEDIRTELIKRGKELMEK